MQNGAKRKSIYFVDECCEIYSFGPVLRVIDYSESFDTHIEYKNFAKNCFFSYGGGRTQNFADRSRSNMFFLHHP